jgi:Acetyltransferases
MIRQATLNDLPAIACVHRVCFPDSYSSQLSLFRSPIGGGNLLESFYMEYMNDNPELFVVADDENSGIVGFCMGYYMDKDDQMQNFFRKNRFCVLWKTFLLLLIGNKQAWNKILSRLKHKPDISDWTIVNDKYEYIKNKERGDLLSVCVLPDCRGKGYAQGMMEYYLDAMKKAGRKLCLLSVKKDNERAKRYYERNGFELYRTRGNEGLTYIKLL